MLPWREFVGRPVAPRGVERQIGEVRVSVSSDLTTVVDDFARLYPASPSETFATGRAIHLEVKRSGRGRTGRRLYRVYADGVEVGGCRPAHGVFPLLEWGINLRVIATRGQYLQFHTASMSYRGLGFIFAGDSGCGKSTLAAMLLARGWQYLCDEFALVDLDTLRLHPFPKALCIKAGSYPVVRRLGLRFARRRDYVKQLKARVGYISPFDVGPRAVAGVTPIRFIVFPEYRGGADSTLRPLSRARAAMLLSRCCFNRPGFSGGALPALARVVGQAPCFRLEVGNSDEPCRLLEAALATQEDSASGPASLPNVPPEVPMDSRRPPEYPVGAKFCGSAPSSPTSCRRCSRCRRPRPSPPAAIRVPSVRRACPLASYAKPMPIVAARTATSGYVRISGIQRCLKVTRRGDHRPASSTSEHAAKGCSIARPQSGGTCGRGASISSSAL